MSHLTTRLLLVLFLGIATIGASAESIDYEVDPELLSELSPQHRFDQFVIEQNFICASGWVIIRQYTLSWQNCQGGLPYACTETHQLVERCIGGKMVTVSDTLIKRECDYVYDGTWCPVDELPWRK